MKKHFRLLTLLIICLCALHNVFGQTSVNNFKEFGEMKDKAQRLRDSKSYRTKTTTEKYAADGTTLKEKIVSTDEFAMPDRRFSSTTIESGGKTAKFEFIEIGEKVFVKEDNGKWRIPRPEPITEPTEPTTGLGNTTGGKFIEQTTFNGQTVKVYEENTNTYFGDDGRSTTTRFWFNEAGELLKTEAKERNLKTDEISRIVTIYEYDPNIKIEAPIKPDKKS